MTADHIAAQKQRMPGAAVGREALAIQVIRSGLMDKIGELTADVAQHFIGRRWMAHMLYSERSGGGKGEANNDSTWSPRDQLS